MKGVRNGENVMSKKDLTPRERSTLLVLKHSPEPYPFVNCAKGQAMNRPSLLGRASGFWRRKE